jgi:hypothetical protein
VTPRTFRDCVKTSFLHVNNIKFHACIALLDIGYATRRCILSAERPFTIGHVQCTIIDNSALHVTNSA